jgi:hypothetical protein
MSRNVELMPSRPDSTELSLAELDHVAGGETVAVAGPGSTQLSGPEDSGNTPDFGFGGKGFGGFRRFGRFGRT